MDENKLVHQVRVLSELDVLAIFMHSKEEKIPCNAKEGGSAS